MQTLARVTDALGQKRLDVHVNVLVIQRELHLIGLDVGQNGLKPLDDLIRLRLLNDALLAQHARVGNGTGNILPVHAGVKADRGVKIVDQRVRFLLESSCPEFHNTTQPFAEKCGMQGRHRPPLLCLAEFVPAGTNKVKLFFARTCAGQKILLGHQTCKRSECAADGRSLLVKKALPF